MQQKRTAEDLERRLESLKMDLQITKQQYRVRHTHLVNATRRLGKAIEELARPSEKLKT